MLRKELKEKFTLELTPYEKVFFLKKAKEAIEQKGYPSGEDLFWYCYFLTLRERMRGIDAHDGEGYVRFLLAQGSKDVEETVKMYEERLEKNKLPGPAPSSHKFMEYFSG